MFKDVRRIWRFLRTGKDPHYQEAEERYERLLRQLKELDLEKRRK